MLISFFGRLNYVRMKVSVHTHRSSLKKVWRKKNDLWSFFFLGSFTYYFIVVRTALIIAVVVAVVASQRDEHASLDIGKIGIEWPRGKKVWKTKATNTKEIDCVVKIEFGHKFNRIFYRESFLTRHLSKCWNTFFSFETYLQQLACTQISLVHRLFSVQPYFNVMHSSC